MEIMDNESVLYKITPVVRKMLAEPMGLLLAGTPEENIKKLPRVLNEIVGKFPERPFIYCVGDVVSDILLASVLEKFVHACFLDGRTKRKEHKVKSGTHERIILELVNPPGTITGRAFGLVKSLDPLRRYIIYVEGEEDLLVIPLILNVNERSVVIYGQPPITDLGRSIPAGMVVLYPDTPLKNKVSELLNLFERIKSGPPGSNPSV